MFLKILLIILFIIFVLPLILALMGIGLGFKMLNRFKKSKSSQTGGYSRSGQSTRSASGAGHGKIISDDEGEYVEFEETPRK